MKHAIEKVMDLVNKPVYATTLKFVSSMMNPLACCCVDDARPPESCDACMHKREKKISYISADLQHKV